jgi:predicted nuclease of predicted toxin-antitoxin system
VSLLFDENLSVRRVRQLESAYPDCQHVEIVGLRAQSDLDVWGFAARTGATLVSKDS